MMNTSGIKPEAVEQTSNSLYRDYRNLRKALSNEDLDNHTTALLNKLGRTVEDARKMMTDLYKECQDKK